MRVTSWKIVFSKDLLCTFKPSRSVRQSSKRRYLQKHSRTLTHNTHNPRLMHFNAIAISNGPLHLHPAPVILIPTSQSLGKQKIPHPPPQPSTSASSSAPLSTHLVGKHTRAQAANDLFALELMRQFEHVIIDEEVVSEKGGFVLHVAEETADEGGDCGV